MAGRWIGFCLVVLLLLLVATMGVLTLHPPLEGFTPPVIEKAPPVKKQTRPKLLISLHCSATNESLS